MTKKILGFFVLFSFLIVQKPSGTTAEESQTPSDQIKQNLELSYMAGSLSFIGDGNLDKLLFEANIAPAFFTPEFHLGGHFMVTVTPKIVLRMFRTRSNPINSPSYMPRVTLFAWLQDSVPSDSFFHYFSATLSHHSNGQDGDFFDANTGLTNRRNGSFSTDWVEVAYHFNFPGTGRLAVTGLDLGIEQHLGFERNLELDGHYGYRRAHFGSDVRWKFATRWEMKINLKFVAILDKLERLPLQRQGEFFPSRYIGSAESSIRQESFGQFGFFVKAYYGQDYYNMFFDRNLFSVFVGFSIDMADWKSFRRSKPKEKTE